MKCPNCSTSFSTGCLDSSMSDHKYPMTITRTESDSSACSDASSSADMYTPVPVTTASIAVSSGWAYAVLQSLLFGLVALSAQRFRYLWVPQACVIAAAGVGSSHAWRAALEKVGCSDKMVSVGYMYL